MASTATSHDVEAGRIGAFQQYPAMAASPEKDWIFIRKVYAILSTQWLVTIIVSLPLVFAPHISLSRVVALIIYCIFLLSLLILMWPLNMHLKRHPHNVYLLGLFTVVMAFAVGWACYMFHCVVVVSLTLYTFLAVKRGWKPGFTWPFVFTVVMVLIVAILIQLTRHRWNVWPMLLYIVTALGFSACIVSDMNDLIERFTYSEYVPAVIALYLDPVNFVTCRVFHLAEK